MIESSAREISGPPLEGVLIGYALCDPDKDWAEIRALLENPATVFLVRYSGYRAMLRLRRAAPDVVSEKMELAVLDRMLQQADMTDFIVHQLLKDRNWKLTGTILKVQKLPTHQTSLIRKSILEYARECPDDEARRFLNSGKTNGSALDKAFEYWLLTVRYVADKGNFFLGYYDDDKNIIYRWKGVDIKKEHLTNLGPFNRSTVLVAADATMELVDPPVQYTFDKMNIGRVGYLDRSHVTFYQWKGIEVKRAQMLALDEKGNHAVVSHRDHFFRVIEIDPPRHLLGQPQRWKKTTAK